MPIDDRKAPARFQDRSNAVRKTCFVRDAVERVRYEHEVDRSSYEVVNGVGIAFDKVAIGRPNCANFCSRKRQHARIDIDGYDAPDHQGKRCGEKAVATTKVNHIHVRSHA